MDSRLASVGKLREWLNYKINRFDSDHGTIVLNTGVNPDDLYDLTDEIEREVSERYMLLPVDADGVPWHIGDMTENGNIVNGITFDRHGAHFTSTLNDINPSIHVHAKPRTIEDVLCDMIHEYGSTDALTETIAAKYAAELRGMMEADE